MGGAVVVALYRLGFPNSTQPPSSSSLKKNKTSGSPGSGLSTNGDGFLVTPYLRILEIAMHEDQDKLIEKVRGTYGFRVTHGKLKIVLVNFETKVNSFLLCYFKGPNGQIGYWVINAKTGKGSVTYNGKEKPDVTFIMKDADVVELISGKLQPQKAFFQGKVKVQGNMGLAMKLIDLQKTAQGRIEELKAKL